MNLFETLLHPDREELELKDRMVVVSAANLLQVGEFQLLQLAYREWFGEELPEETVDRLFIAFMLYNKVPHWARDYARKILDGDERGEIDDGEPAYHRYDYDYHTSVPNGVIRFYTTVIALSVVIGGGMAFANLTETSPTTTFPPFFDEKELSQSSTGFSWGRSDIVPLGGGQP